MNYNVKDCGNYSDITIYLDEAFSQEFGLDFNATKGVGKRAHQEIKDFLSEKFPETNFRQVKFILSGLVVGSILLSKADVANAATLEGSTLQNSNLSQTYYTVKTGDTLYFIATKNGTSVDVLKTVNNLKSDTLYVGQTIVVPIKQVVQENYTVKSGDTLWTISKKYNLTTDELMTANNLKTDSLSIGQILKIPVKSNTPAPLPVVTNEYVVKSGDTLWGIASENNVTVDAIKSANNLKTDSLSVGQKLIIPVPSTTSNPTTAGLNSAIVSKIKYFPFPKTSTYTPFTDNYAAPREWTATGSVQRSHEGVDIMAPMGQPVVSVSDGTVIRKGWSDTGGWRLTIQLDGVDNAIYYAHFSAYANNINVGTKVTAGQVIGYVGNTGYGPEGTSGKFDTHLHFGIYNTKDWTTIDPYSYLKYLEPKRK